MPKAPISSEAQRMLRDLSADGDDTYPALAPGSSFEAGGVRYTLKKVPHVAEAPSGSGARSNRRARGFSFLLPLLKFLKV